MAATYDSTSIASSPRDMVRFMIGDTGPTSWLFQNEEVEAMLTLGGGRPLRAAVLLAKRLSAQLAGTEALSRSIGDLAISIRGGSEAWAQFADDLERFNRENLNLSSGMRLASGGSYAELPHLFRIGQHDHADAAPAWDAEPDVRFDR